MNFPRHKCGLFLTHNEHRDYYQSAQDFIENDLESRECPPEWSTSTSRQCCIDANEIWELQWYPDTPIGSYCVVGATLEEVLEWAAEVDRETAYP